MNFIAVLIILLGASAIENYGLSMNGVLAITLGVAILYLVNTNES